MEMVKMITTAEHQYAGKRLYAGDEFDCEDQHIELMAKMGWAKPAKRSTYGTRALTASTKSSRRRRK